MNNRTHNRIELVDVIIAKFLHREKYREQPKTTNEFYGTLGGWRMNV